MKKIIGNSIDVIFISSLLIFFYACAFGNFGHGRIHDPLMFQLFRINMFIVFAAILILPFRVRRYPRISHFVIYKRDGCPRTNFVLPALVFAAFFLVFISIVRLAFLFSINH